MAETLQTTLRQGALGQPDPGQQAAADPNQALRQKLQQQQLNQQSPQLVRDASGQLTQQSNQGIQQLAATAGLPAPPTTALGAAAIGANPDQQKMMGTPAQKQAALTLATAPQNDLTTAVRQAQVRSQQTQTEQAESQKSQDMNNLGSLGSRVSDFIDAQRQKLAAADTAATANPSSVQAQVQTAATVAGNGSTDALATMTPDQATSTKNLLSQLRSDPTNQQLMLQVNQALGYDVNTQLDPAKINDLYESAVDTISRSGANTVDNSLTTQDLLNNSKFGYTGDQLSNLLGVPQDQLAKMTVGQLRQTIDNVTQQEFTKAQTLQQQAGSVNLGAAERGQARQAGQEASATGIRASEDDMNRMVQSIANADTVQFGGKSYQVDNLLKDSTISGIITDYINSAPNSDTRTQLDQTEPQLSKFIADNQAVLTDAANKLQAGASTFQATQTYNKNLGQQIFGTGGLSSDVASALIPEASSLQAGKIDINDGKHNVLAYAQNAGPQGAMVVAQQINNQQAKDPTTASQLASLSADQVKSLDIANPAGNWAQGINFKNTLSTIKSSTDLATLAPLVYNNVTSALDLTNKMTTAKSMAVLGLGQAPDTSLTDPTAIKNKILSQVSDASWAQIADNGVPAMPAKTDFPNSVAPPITTVEGSLFNKLSDAAASGTISSDAIKGAGLNLDEANTLLDLAKSGKGNIDTDAAASVQHGLLIDNTNQAAKSTDMNNGDAVNKLVLAAKSDPQHYDQATVDKAIEPRIQAAQNAINNWGGPGNNLGGPDNIFAGVVPSAANGSSAAQHALIAMTLSSAPAHPQNLSIIRNWGVEFNGDNAHDFAQLARIAPVLGLSSDIGAWSQASMS